MQLKSSLLFAILIVVSFSMIDAGAQAETNCPLIIVNGPAGIVSSGELISFPAYIHGDTDSLKPTYTWSLSSGKIVSGQGTRSIVVDNEDRGITATVDVGGLPTECPRAASGYYGGDPPPKAEKLYEVPGHQALTELNIGFLTDTLRQYRSDQLYVIIHGRNDVSNGQRQDEVSRAFKAKGLPSDRITIVTVFWEPNVTQFWRIPPGVENPEPGQFEERNRDAKSCPTILVIGPAGVSMPGDTMTFSASVNGDLPTGVKYSWSVTDATILTGQGTRMITVRHDGPKWGNANPTATIFVLGLPKNCQNSASAKDATSIDWVSFIGIEYGSMSLAKELEQLDSVDFGAATEGPFRLYVSAGVRRGVRLSSLRSRAARLTAYFRTKGIGASKISFRFHEDQTGGTLVYFVLPYDEPISPSGRLILQIP